MASTPKQLATALQRAIPGERLEFEDVSAETVETVLKNLGNSAKTRQRQSKRSRDFDMGAHVSVSVQWWGVRIEFDHEAVKAQQESFTFWNLLSVGVPPPVAGIISGSVRMIAAQDRGNGVVAFVTWALVHWYLPR